MQFARLRSLPRTLHFRLLLWNTLVVLLLGILALIGAREGARWALLHEFDAILSEDIQEIKLALKQFSRDLSPLYGELVRKAEGHAHRGWFVQLLDADRQVVWSSPGAPSTPIPATSPTQTITLGGVPYRVLQSPGTQPHLKAQMIRVGASEASLQEDIYLLTRMMVLAILFSVVLAPLGGYWLATRATRPLAQIIRTTARLRPSELHERLPLRGTGDELDQLSRTINGMLDRIGRYLDQKRDFIANAAHELRSPLTAIRASVEVALNRSNSEEDQTLLADVVEECTSLAALINKLLLLAEGDAGRLSIGAHPVQLDRIVDRTLAMFEGVAEAEGITLQRFPLPQVEVAGEAFYFRQVVQNLLDNAIKFTAPGGTVSVRLDVVREKGEAVLEVRDSGRGIEAADLPRVFERFYRADRSRQRSQEPRGNGLGLSICQAIVEALRGRIDVESQPGKGSAFRVYLPLLPNGLPYDSK